jgi:uncharacterized protein
MKTHAEPFRCRRCGACCRWPGSVLLDDADLASAAKALGMEEMVFIQSCTELAANRAQLTLRERDDGACLFLEDSGTCRIYAARPRQCRDFPRGWRVEGCPALDAPGNAVSRSGENESGAPLSAMCYAKKYEFMKLTASRSIDKGGG